MTETEHAEAPAPLAEYVAGFRDGVVSGFDLGSRNVTDARREAAEDGYRRGQQSAARFYASEPDDHSSWWILGALVIVAILAIQRIKELEREVAEHAV